MAVPAAIAQSQDLGHKILGGIGLDAGTQPDAGLYIGDRFLYYRADELFDRNGERIPVKGLDIKAMSNVGGVSRTFKLDGAWYFNASIAAPITRLSLNSDEPRASIDRFGFGDLFVEPARLGLRHPHFDVVTSYGFYAPTGRGGASRRWREAMVASGVGWRHGLLRRTPRLAALRSCELRRLSEENPDRHSTRQHGADSGRIRRAAFSPHRRGCCGLRALAGPGRQWLRSTARPQRRTRSRRRARAGDRHHDPGDTGAARHPPRMGPDDDVATQRADPRRRSFGGRLAAALMGYSRTLVSFYSGARFPK